jgi:hypothetical protein
MSAVAMDPSYFSAVIFIAKPQDRWRWACPDLGGSRNALLGACWPG